MRLVVRLCYACVLLAACGEEPQLTIRLALPIEQLDPLMRCPRQGTCIDPDPRIARFSMRIEERGGTVTEQVVTMANRDSTLGKVPISHRFDLQLSAETAGGSILGHGATRDLYLDEESLTVQLQFRKPIAYIASAQGFDVIDTAADSADDAQLESVRFGDVLATASSPNGKFIASVTSSTLFIHYTDNHARPPREIGLNVATHGLRFSPNSRHIILMQQRQLRVIDLQNAETSIVRSVSGTPSEITFTEDDDIAWLLVDGIGHDDACSSSARSMAVRLENVPGAPFQPQGDGVINLDFAASDIVYSKAMDALLFANPCKTGDAVWAVRLSGGPHGGAVAAPRAYDLSIIDDTLVVVAQNDEPGPATGKIYYRDLVRDESSRPAQAFVIPPISIGLTSDPNASGYFLWASPATGDLTVYDVELTPDRKRALILYRTRFASDLAAPATCPFKVDAIGEGYLVIDLDTGSELVNKLTRLRFDACRADCYSNDSGENLADKARCESTLRATLREQGTLSSESYEPKAAALLFGGY